MEVAWLKEFGFGVLWGFAQPFLYIAIAFTFWTGYRRIIKDRQMFGHRVFPIGAEWRGTWWMSLLFGTLLSAALILTGSMVTYEWILALSLLVLIFTAINRVWLLSPAFTVGFIGLITWISLMTEVELHPWVAQVFEVDLLLVCGLIIFMLLAEITLMWTTKRQQTFPEMKKGNRGKYVGSHIAKRLLFVPFFAPVPEGVLQLSFFEWWPAFGITDTFGLIFVPFFIGYSQRFQGAYSDQGAKQTAKKLIILTAVMLVGAVGAYFIEELAIAVILLGILGRLGIFLFSQYFDSEKRPIFTPRTDGILVVSVIPDSPADDMGIQIGEVIEKIHEIPVSNEHEFFEVMSEHRTYCKLTIRDFNGEARFVQRSLYDGEFHELGLIFVKETPRFTLKTEEVDIGSST